MGDWGGIKDQPLGAAGPLEPLGAVGAVGAAGTCATAARWEALGFLGPLWPLGGGGFGENGVRIRARSTYTITSTTEFRELPSNGLWPQLLFHAQMSYVLYMI